MSNSLLKYLELDSTPIENTFYQGGPPSDYEEDKTLATEYGHQYIELFMHLSNLLSSVSKADSMTQYKKFFTKKFGKHWCCSNPREGTKKMVYTWNLLEQEMGVLNLSTKGFSLEVPYETNAKDAIKMWERFTQECYKP